MGHICINIDKNVLYKRLLSESKKAYPTYVVNNNGMVIIPSYNNQDSVSQYTTSLTRNKEGSRTAYLDGKKYLMVYSETNVQGWRTVQFIPYGDIIKWRMPIFLISLLALIMCYVISVFLAKKKSKLIVTPILNLTETIKLNKRLKNIDDCNTFEMYTVYQTYNKMYDDNNRLIEQIKLVQERQKNAEIMSLITQISPHFLYNTLNVIFWKAYNNNQKELCSIIGKLSKLCKTNYNFKSTLSTFGDELRYNSLYLSLQSECLDGKFNYEIAVPSDYINFEIPRFILQPFIENTIIHGFSQVSGDLLLSITADADEDLYIHITDNGSGIDALTLDKLNRNEYYSAKYGIYNVNERIRLLYGNDYGTSFSCTGGKTCVTIKLPINIIEDKED